MSSRRSRSRQSGTTRITDEQIIDLVSKLQAVLPESRIRSRADRVSEFTAFELAAIYILLTFFQVLLRFVQVSAAKVLQETCNYIRSLHREVDDLSERLSELLGEASSDQAAIIRSLLM